MNEEQIRKHEKRVHKANAIFMLKKLLSGFCIILTVGFCAYALLFLLMLII